jgi:hypothetical protein
MHQKCIGILQKNVWKVTISDQNFKKKSMQSVSSKVHWKQSQIRFVECSQKAHQECIKSASEIHETFFESERKH